MQVGYEPFVDFVDQLGFEVNHIANKKDLVPILPLWLLGYRHVSGEIHIDERNQWMNCPGACAAMCGAPPPDHHC